MMEKIKLCALSVILICTLLPACKKFVEINAPTTELVTGNVFNNVASATAAQTNIYSSMTSNNESSNMEIDLGLLSDELSNYNTSLSYIQFYHNSMTATAGPGPWNNAYNYIYQANAVIEGIQGNAGLSKAIQQQLIGEAKFIRAFWLFYLTNLYGPVPLVTGTSYSINATLARAPQAEIYQQIVADLQNAQSLMNSNYIDATDTAVTMTDRTRPNKWAATALLARVYLYKQLYDSAEMEATTTIGDENISGITNSNGLYRLVGLDSVFLVDNPECIWQLGAPGPLYPSTPDASIFILEGKPTGIHCCSVAPNLLNSFEPNDARRTKWIDSFTTASTTYYFPYKYQNLVIPNTAEAVVALRLGEQFLIRAEARANQNNLIGAINDLNYIRNRAGLGSYSGPTDQQLLLNAILHERQVELFAEWGHRWLDIIRTNSADSIMSRITPEKGGVWNMNNYQLLFPIPQTETKTDANLTQNAGY